MWSNPEIVHNVVALDATLADYPFLLGGPNSEMSDYIFYRLFEREAWKLNDKYTLTKEEYFKINDWLGDNRDIVTAGGSAANCLLTSYHAMQNSGHRLNLTMVGTVGNRTNGQLVRQKFNECNVSVQPVLTPEEQEMIIQGVGYIWLDPNDVEPQKFIAGNTGFGNRELITEYHIHDQVFEANRFDTAFFSGLKRFDINVLRAFRDEIIAQECRIFSPLPTEIPNEDIRLLAMDMLSKHSDVSLSNLDELCNLHGFDRRSQEGRQMAKDTLYSIVQDRVEKPCKAYITDGLNGAFVMETGMPTKSRGVWDNHTKPKSPLGAGDAFNSGVITVELMGGTVEQALDLGSANSDVVIQQIPAQMPPELALKLRESIIKTSFRQRAELRQPSDWLNK